MCLNRISLTLTNPRVTRTSALLNVGPIIQNNTQQATEFVCLKTDG